MVMLHMKNVLRVSMVIFFFIFIIYSTKIVGSDRAIYQELNSIAQPYKNKTVRVVPNVPLFGDLKLATSKFLSADAEGDAIAAFNELGPTLLGITATDVFPGIEPDESMQLYHSGKYVVLYIPMTGDYLSSPEYKKHKIAAVDYAKKFNLKMISLVAKK